MLLLLSCSHHRRTLYIVFDRVDGLIEGSTVEAKGMQIGHVYGMELLRDKVLVTTKIDDHIKIARGSVFRLTDQSYLSSGSAVEVLLSNGDSFYQDDDTILAAPYKARILSSDSASFRSDSANFRSFQKVVQGIKELMKVDSARK